MQFNKLLGGTLIVSGTAIGGGMLALPLASAFAGYQISLIVLVAMWALMTYTALITLEMNLHFGQGASIALAAEHALGKKGKAISAFAIGFLFFALLSAYMSGGSSILQATVYNLTHVSLPTPVFTIVFGAIFSAIVFARTRIVDTANRWLLLLKAILFITIVASLSSNVDMEKLNFVPVTLAPQLLILIPLFFTSFGFHGSIPSIVNYIGQNPRHLTATFIIGSLIPLFVYIIWETISLGVIPIDGPQSFSTIKDANGDVGVFINVLSMMEGKSWLNIAAQLFTFLAIATSFLGVGLGLFDFMEEQFSKSNQTQSEWVTWAQTFIIPLLFALFYPKGFVMALGFAAIALSLLAVIIPTLTVWRLRCSSQTSLYTVWGGSLGLLIALLCGVGVIVIELYSILGQFF